MNDFLFKTAFDALRKSNIKPFHDDPHLQELIVKIVRDLGIKTFFETGTFRGDSLEWIAERFPSLRCYSVEKNWLYHRYSTTRLEPLGNVKVIKGDSRDALSGSLSLEWPVLFWLDAHWQQDWPLTDELRVIRHLRLLPCVFIIDDFQVPEHPSLGFDSYNGQPLSKDYLASSLQGLKTFAPNYDAKPGQELRGYLVAFQNLEPVASESLSPI